MSRKRRMIIKKKCKKESNDIIRPIDKLSFQSYYDAVKTEYEYERNKKQSFGYKNFIGTWYALSKKVTDCKGAFPNEIDLYKLVY